jgi:TPR repeat protein
MDPAYPIGTALGHLTLAERQAGRMLEHETARLVLIVDQLEELFTNESLVPADRERFMAVLVGLVRSGHVWVIATMRSDFWHRAVETPQLMQLAQGGGRLELLPPTPLQIAQMIRRPAAAAGILFEHHAATDVPLNDMIAEEVAHEPGALPLLSYLLDQLQIAVLLGHEKRIASAVYSPDQTRIITASFDKTARIWDAATGAQMQVLAHDSFVLWAEFSPDQRRIVTAASDNTVRVWDAATGTELAVLAGHADSVRHAMFSPDGKHIVSASIDKTVRLWGAEPPADLDRQIVWSRAAQIDPLSNVERNRLGLPRDKRIRLWTSDNKCDVAAAATYDPDRLAAGVALDAISPDIAASACAVDGAKPADSIRFHYQMGRVMAAKRDFNRAHAEFELAVKGGYRAAKLALADLLARADSDMLDPVHAVNLYLEAWNSGVPRAAFELASLYERGGPGLPADAGKASVWFAKGADVGEPNALAYLAARDEASVISEGSVPKRRALLLKAFSGYAAAAERAQNEGWPDEIWRVWRYRRATLARLLARAGMMPEVADAYTQVRNNSTTQWPGSR